MYDAKGRLVHEADVGDYDGDGPEPATTQAIDTTFDKLGYALQKVLTTDFDSDGVPEQSSTYTFGNDHKGRAVATTVDQDYDGDGAVETVVHEVVDYDARGRVLRDAATYETPQGELLGRGESVNAYDQHGQVTLTSQSSYAADGSCVSRDATDTTFDVHGNALAIATTYDEDGMPGTDYRTVRQTSTTATTGSSRRRRVATSATAARPGSTRPGYAYDGPGDYVSARGRSPTTTATGPSSRRAAWT